MCFYSSAFYSEPRLSIHGSSTTVIVQFETEGFPKPEVIWLDEHGQSLIHHLELHDQTEDGLYLVRSRYEAQKPAINVTFTLKNHLLNQNLERPVIYGKELHSEFHVSKCVNFINKRFGFGIRLLSLTTDPSTLSDTKRKQEKLLIYTHSALYTTKNHDPNLYLHTKILDDPHL